MTVSAVFLVISKRKEYLLKTSQMRRYSFWLSVKKSLAISSHESAEDISCHHG